MGDPESAPARGSVAGGMTHQEVSPVSNPDDIPYGYCHCGCGEKTAIAPHTDRWAGHVRGEPYRFLPRHAHTVNGFKRRKAAIQDLRDMWATAGIPYGYCLCGCGEPTAVSNQTNLRIGHVAGEPVKFIRGHANRNWNRWTVEDRGYGTGCWIWALNYTHDGYGRYSRTVDGGQHSGPAHRAIWEEMRGPIPEGLQLDHLCRQRDCVNPDHLEPVTNAENVRRSPATKLDWPKVRAIRAAIAAGDDRHVLAESYGVSRSTINAIACGQNWPLDHDPGS